MRPWIDDPRAAVVRVGVDEETTMLRRLFDGSGAGRRKRGSPKGSGSTGTRRRIAQDGSVTATSVLRVVVVPCEDPDDARTTYVDAVLDGDFRAGARTLATETGTVMTRRRPAAPQVS
jgi:hypothetical protein